MKKRTIKQLSVKLTSVICAAALLLMLLPVYSFAAGGSGTAADPYIINSAAELKNIRNNLSAHYKLGSDIDMSGTDFEPVGNDVAGAFKGVLDGNGHTIRNLSINADGNKYVGLFGYLDGTVKNLNFENANIYGHYTRYIGALAGYTEQNAVVSGCNVYSGSLKGTYIFESLEVGGIVGYNKGEIRDCENKISLDISYVDHAGGIAGYNAGTIFGCSNVGDVTVYSESHSYAGGITGYNRGAISDCDNGGDISSYTNFNNPTVYIGEIAGFNAGDISRCNNIGNITDLRASHSVYLGGIVGNNSGTISECSNSGIISTPTNLDSWYIFCGGIAGKNGGVISNCSNSGKVSAFSYDYVDSHVGGIAGSNAGTISGCSNTGAVTASSYDPSSYSPSSYVGGIAGYNGRTISNCCNDAELTAKAESVSVYGIAYNGTIYNCINKRNAYSFGGSTVKNIEISNMSLKVGETHSIDINKYGYDKALKWTVQDSDIAEIDDSGNITGKKEGTTIILAETELGIKAAAFVTVSTNDNNDKIVSLNKTSAELYVGDTLQLTAQTSPENAITPITWSSNNSSVATVDSTGLVTAKGSGVAVISADMRGSSSFYCVVQVTSEEQKPEVASISIPQKEYILAPGDATALNVVVTPSGAGDIIYTSDNEAVAVVNAQGIVTAKGAGIAVIRASAPNSIYDECVIRIVSAESAGIILSADKAMAGDTVSVTASIVKNPGISAYKLNITYDDTLVTPLSVTANGDFNGKLTTNLDEANPGSFNVLWYSDEDVTLNGDLFTIEFKVADIAADGDVIPIDVSYGADDICNVNGDKFAFNTSGAEIKVDIPQPGDIYEDGSITVYDLTLLARYITGLEKFTARQMAAGDMNGDGDVDIKDVVALAQYVVSIGAVDTQPAELSSVTESDTNAAEDGDIRIITSSAKTNENRIAYIPVSIENNTGIAGFRYEPEYNRDELEILGIIPNRDILGDNMQTNLGSENDGALVVSWYSDKNMTSDGVLFTIKARLADGVDSAGISIKRADNNMCDEAPQNVIGEYTDGAVTLSEAEAFVIESGEAGFTVKNASGHQQEATVIVAEYVGDRIAGTEIYTYDFAVDESKAFDIAADKKYRIFVWDGINSMAPLTRTAMIGK